MGGASWVTRWDWAKLSWYGHLPTSTQHAPHQPPRLRPDSPRLRRTPRSLPRPRLRQTPPRRPLAAPVPGAPASTPAPAAPSPRILTSPQTNVQAIFLAAHFQDEWPVLVMAPGILLEQWRHEIAKWGGPWGVTLDQICVIKKGSPPTLDNPIPSHPIRRHPRAYPQPTMIPPPRHHRHQPHQPHQPHQQAATRAKTRC